MDAPPCLCPGQPMNACARGVYAWEITATGPLPGPWAGWRLAGNVLISPDRDRITPERLRGLLFLESLKRSPGGKVRPAAPAPVVAISAGAENAGEQREASP